MKPIPLLASVILASAALAACSPGIHGRIGYNVDFQNGELVSHAPGRPDAYISADGSLRIGGHAVATTPAQRALLKDYYAQSHTLIAEGKAVGTAGAELGVHAISDVIKSIFSSNSKQTDKTISAQADVISTAAQTLCSGIEQMHHTQQAIAAQLPAFKPYDAVGDTKCVFTTAHSATVAGSPAAASTTLNVTVKPPAA